LPPGASPPTARAPRPSNTVAIAIMAVVSQIGGSVSGMFEMLKDAFG
jgi:hypothetical protein